MVDSQLLDIGPVAADGYAVEGMYTVSTSGQLMYCTGGTSSLVELDFNHASHKKILTTCPHCRASLPVEKLNNNERFIRCDFCRSVVDTHAEE